MFIKEPSRSSSWWFFSSQYCKFNQIYHITFFFSVRRWFYYFCHLKIMLLNILGHFQLEFVQFLSLRCLSSCNLLSSSHHRTIVYSSNSLIKENWIIKWAPASDICSLTQISVKLQLLLLVLEPVLALNNIKITFSGFCFNFIIIATKKAILSDAF